ncbi:MAG: toxin [Xanthomonadales bacterium]|nr:toxin [Xanthomonadales bacterium]
MSLLDVAVDQVLEAQQRSGKPLAVMLAGHNGSGKSTLWYSRLAPRLQLPLINADRMLLSVLPEAGPSGLPAWARRLRDTDLDWMHIGQKGVEAFTLLAMTRGVAIATETVFSHWQPRSDGSVSSKIDKIHELQAAGYFVVLVFVGLVSVELSIARVATRVAAGGHDVEELKLRQRFPRSQRAVSAAAPIADATLMADNSLEEAKAFAVCRVQLGHEVLYDRRDQARTPAPIRAWMDVVSPRETPRVRRR